MRYTTSIIPRTLLFKKPAGTSRGVMHQHTVWYVLVETDEGVCGVGECAPLPGLSCDALPESEYVHVLHSACQQLEQEGQVNYAAFAAYPSIVFGLETAMQHVQAGGFALWNTPFSRGEAGIPINGLVWMGGFDAMHEQIEAKLAAGFSCIKLKIGAIDFEQELALLRHIRAAYPAERITIRVDANGAFTPEEAPEKLRRLAEFALHSIEQPIRAGQWGALGALARHTPVPIALDEELIGIADAKVKMQMLESIQPQFIVLKPSLHGGMRGCKEWITLAEGMGIGWWLTSALESNIGLNAIAQWCATLHPTMAQGLGTGLLYHNNVPVPLFIRQDALWFAPAGGAQGDSLQPTTRQTLACLLEG